MAALRLLALLGLVATAQAAVEGVSEAQPSIPATNPHTHSQQDIIINEILVSPSVVDDGLGEWFEVYNPTMTAINMNGWYIGTADTFRDYRINRDVIVEPMGYAVIGRKSDSLINGNAPVDFGYNSRINQLNNVRGSITVYDNTKTVIDNVDYDLTLGWQIVHGASIMLISPELDNDIAENWCLATVPWDVGTDKGTPNAENICRTNPTGGGDPHFRTWTGQHFGFQGACDMVLLTAPQLDLDIHIRTKIRQDYSYISSVAVRLEDDILEVTTNKHHDHYLNGVKNAPLTQLGGYALFHGQPSELERGFRIRLADDEVIHIRTWKDFASVTIRNGSPQHFRGALGLMGSFQNGRLVARDGVTPIQDPAALAREWQVRQDNLFQTLQIPQYPQECRMPEDSVTQRRRLAEALTAEQAAAACEHVAPEDQAFCVADVLSTNDVEMVHAYV